MAEDDKPKKPLIQNIPNDLENDSHLFTTPFDVQNTDLTNFINLIFKDKYTPKISLDGAKLATVCRVIEQKGFFEYNSTVELETFFRKEKDPKRFKVFIHGEAGALSVAPINEEDELAINLLNDYSLATTFGNGEPTVGEIVYVDLKSRTIISRLQDQDSITPNTTNNSKTPSSKQTVSGPPANTGPVTIDKIPDDVTEDEAWGLKHGKPISLGKIKLKAVVSYSGQKLRADAADKFNELCKEAAKQNIKIVATSGFRKMQTQINLYNERWQKKYPSVTFENRRNNTLTQKGRDFGVAGYPGTSNHQGGIAVDIDVGPPVRGDSKADPHYRYAENSTMMKHSAYQWMKANASRFNFDNKEGYDVNEPWHWVYTGKAPVTEEEKQAAAD